MVTIIRIEFHVHRPNNTEIIRVDTYNKLLGIKKAYESISLITNVDEKQFEGLIFIGLTKKYDKEIQLFKVNVNI